MPRCTEDDPVTQRVRGTVDTVHIWLCYCVRGCMLMDISLYCVGVCARARVCVCVCVCAWECKVDPSFCVTSVFGASSLGHCGALRASVSQILPLFLLPLHPEWSLHTHTPLTHTHTRAHTHTHTHTHTRTHTHTHTGALVDYIRW